MIQDQGCKKSVPLVPAAQGSLTDLRGENCLFSTYSYTFEWKFTIYSCCGTLKQNISCSPIRDSSPQQVLNCVRGYTPMPH